MMASVPVLQLIGVSNLLARNGLVCQYTHGSLPELVSDFDPLHVHVSHVMQAFTSCSVRLIFHCREYLLDITYLWLQADESQSNRLSLPLLV